jgi:hypothetical protein
MKPELIKAIFTNLLFVIGIILIVIGFIRGVSTTVNSIVFDQYPLEEWQETRCSLDLGYQDPQLSPTDAKFPETQEAYEQRKIECEAALDIARQTKQVNDISQSVSFLVSGLALALIFKRFIFSS